jgi:hypothetical protein
MKRKGEEGIGKTHLSIVMYLIMILLLATDHI